MRFLVKSFKGARDCLPHFYTASRACFAVVDVVVGGVLAVVVVVLVVVEIVIRKKRHNP